MSESKEQTTEKEVILVLEEKTLDIKEHIEMTEKNLQK